MTDEERLKLRIKELEARNKHLEMENDFAKSYKSFTVDTVYKIGEDAGFYLVILELNQEKNYSIIRLCQLLEQNF